MNIFVLTGMAAVIKQSFCQSVRPFISNI